MPACGIALQKGKCFEIDGEIFACGEVVSPTAAGMEKGRIMASVPPHSNARIVPSPNHNLVLPDISLVTSISDDCMSPHSYKVPIPHDEKSWDMAVLDKKRRPRKSPMKKTMAKNKLKEENVENASARVNPLSTSFWKLMFNSKASSNAAVPTKQDNSSSATARTLSLMCPTCSSELLVQKNIKTDQCFPPFCVACKSYYVTEDLTDGDELDSLVSSLSSDDQGGDTECPSKGKIIVLEKKSSLPFFETLCSIGAMQVVDEEMRTLGTATDTTKTSTGNEPITSSRISTEVEETKVRQLSPELALDMTSSSTTLTEQEIYFSKDIQIGSEESELTFSQSGDMSTNTDEEEMHILMDRSQIQGFGEKAILKKSQQNYNLTNIECKRCLMALMENNGELICVTCPKIHAKAKDEVALKRLERKEGLMKLEFISSLSASTSNEATSCQEWYKNGVNRATSFEEDSTSTMLPNPSTSKEDVYSIKKYTDHDTNNIAAAEMNVGPNNLLEIKSKTEEMNFLEKSDSYVGNDVDNPDPIGAWDESRPSSQQPVFVPLKDFLDSSQRVSSSNNNMEITHGNIIDEDCNNAPSHSLNEKSCDETRYHELGMSDHYLGPSGGDDGDDFVGVDAARVGMANAVQNQEDSLSSGSKNGEHKVSRIYSNDVRIENECVRTENECARTENECARIENESVENLDRSEESETVPTTSSKLPKELSEHETSRGALNKAEERYHQEMETYLNLSSSFENSMSNCMTLQDDNYSHSIDMVNSTEPSPKTFQPEEHGDFSRPGDTLRADSRGKVDEKIINDDKLLVEKDQHKTEEMQTLIVRLPSISEESESDAESMGEKCEAVAEILRKVPPIAMEIKPTLAFESSKDDDFEDPKCTENSAMCNGMKKGNGFIGDLNEIVSDELTYPLSSMSCNSVQSRDDIVCTNEPILSMSFSLPHIPMDHNAYNYDHANSSCNIADENEDIQEITCVNPMELMQKVGRLNEGGASEEDTIANDSASQLLRDLTNCDNYSQKPRRQQRGPCPELRQSRRIVAKPLNSMRRKRTESVGQGQIQVGTVNQPRDRQEHFMTLLRQLDSVAIRISALEKFTGSQVLLDCMASGNHTELDGTDSSDLSQKEVIEESCQGNGIYRANQINDIQSNLNSQHLITMQKEESANSCTPQLSVLMKRLHNISQSMEEIDQSIEKSKVKEMNKECTKNVTQKYVL